MAQVREVKAAGLAPFRDPLFLAERGLLLLVLMAVSLHGQDQQPDSRNGGPVRTDDTEGRRIPIGEDEVFLPRGFALREGRFDVLVHFHGAPAIVRRNAVDSGYTGALLIVNRKGLSKAYETPFLVSGAFDRLLDEAGRAIAAEARTRARPGRIIISSFSAGYGAVRAILQQPDTARRIDALLLFDSLHAGYDGERRPEARSLEPFVTFAGLAAERKSVFFSTHSALVPADYASTTETNDHLIRRVGASRSPASGTDAQGMRLTSRADRGWFHVRGYAGEGGEDHLRHLRFMAEIYREAWKEVAGLPSRKEE